MPANGFQERPWHAQEDGEGGRGPGVVVVLAQDAAAAGQGIFVELHLGPAVITSHPRIFTPAAGACQVPPSTSCSECERLGYGRGRFMIASGL